MTGRPRTDPFARFRAKVDFDNRTIPSHRPDLGECWTWMGNLTHDGYGRFWFEGRTVPAHRWLLEQNVGRLAPGMEPDHLCLNRACVRLSHLEVVTQHENLIRAGALRAGRAIGNAAIQAAKTHCPSRHEYTPENTYTRAGRRQCRACARQRWHDRKAA